MLRRFAAGHDCVRVGEEARPVRGTFPNAGAGEARVRSLAAPGSKTAEDSAPVSSHWLNFQGNSAQRCDFLCGSTPSTRTRGKGDCTWIANRPEIVIGSGRAAFDDLDIARNTACGCISHRGDLVERNFDIRIPTFPHQSTSDPASDNDAVIPDEEGPVPTSQLTTHIPGSSERQREALNTRRSEHVSPGRPSDSRSTFR
jgi:hypothetical protein